MILEPLYYVSYATLVWGDLGFINFVDNTRLSQNQMAWLQWGRINYKHQFMSLHVVDSRSQTQALSCCYLNTILECNWFSIVDVESTSKLDYGRFNSLMGPSSPYFKLIYHDDMVYESWIGPRFILVHKDVLVITQGCIRDSEQGLQIRVID